MPGCEVMQLLQACSSQAENSLTPFRAVLLLLSQAHRHMQYEQAYSHLHVHVDIYRYQHTFTCALVFLLQLKQDIP